MIYHNFYGVWFLMLLKLRKWKWANWPAHREVLNYSWFYRQSATTLALAAPVAINELDHGVTCKERSDESSKKMRTRPRWTARRSTGNYRLGWKLCKPGFEFGFQLSLTKTSLLVCVLHAKWMNQTHFAVTYRGGATRGGTAPRFILLRVVL